MKRLLLALLLAATPLAAWADCAPGQVDLRLTNGGMARFSVEVVDSPETRAKGLMFRENMPKSSGMLFIYERPQRAVFWMKNTLIPLDMIFADATGLVQHVHANAIPHDETGIDGGEGILTILEINGGLAERLGITPGAVIRHPDLEQSTAQWRCVSQ
ncbi:hypothetical protein SAMN05216227_100721 [Pseudorhodobacter antarcticus]|jgi:hypothetical protein|uniref:DUF192 domain-containing protein n=1 Tax=Pseudorhodobacter antarcticus TaxID=1077947 RepID=A0A1H8DKR5_9RHOB|nr:DUF192 domain-containing protein [Pseudorhodobacter antarcticus]SEN07127.1 hypothetical protein SAMN05216227_100721 [Pseudorhodobacter antarcticus]